MTEEKTLHETRVSRRNVLKTAGVLGSAFALGGPAGHATAQTSSTPWTIVAIPDTQKYTLDPSLMVYPQDQTDWIVANKGAMNIAFVTHEGDLVENGDEVTQWQRIDAVMDTLDGVVPYSTLLGNHDYAVIGDRSSSIENYRTYFGRSRYQGYSWFGGAAPDDRGYYQRFSAGGYGFLHISLEWGVPGSTSNANTTMGWAQSVLNANPDTPTIITTHAYIWDKPGYEGHATDRRRANSGRDIFLELVKPNPQVFMVLNGHYHRADGEWAQVSQNDAGLDVYEMLADYQHYSNGGNGWMRLIEFVPGGGASGPDRIRVRTYSPTLNQYQADSRSQFSFDLSFADRFSGSPGAEEPPTTAEPPTTEEPTTKTLTIESADGTKVNYTFTVSSDDLTKSKACGASINSGTRSPARQHRAVSIIPAETATSSAATSPASALMGRSTPTSTANRSPSVEPS